MKNIHLRGFEMMYSLETILKNTKIDFDRKWATF